MKKEFFFLFELFSFFFSLKNQKYKFWNKFFLFVIFLSNCQTCLPCVCWFLCVKMNFVFGFVLVFWCGMMRGGIPSIDAPSVGYVTDFSPFVCTSRGDCCAKAMACLRSLFHFLLLFPLLLNTNFHQIHTSIHTYIHILYQHIKKRKRFSHFQEKLI